MAVRRTKVIGAAIVLALAGGGAYAYLGFWRGDHAVPSEIVLYGNVDIREVQPAFNANGHITAILVQEGSVVKRGELLATLDDTRYAAALDQVEAQMRNQKQVLDKLLAGSRPEEIAQAKATMDALQATYLNNEEIYRRYVQLATNSVASIQQRDNAPSTGLCFGEPGRSRFEP